jgi:hypothetical protein
MPRSLLPVSWQRCTVSLALALIVLLFDLSSALAVSGSRSPAAVDPPNQGFYSQAANYGEGFGYIIADIPGGPPFFSVFQALGGGASLGYPLSSPYTDADTGDMYLPLERALLIWHSATGQVSVANVFELLDNAGLEQWLLDRGIPRPIEDDGGSTFQESREIRLSWLTDTGIYNSFLQNPLDPGNLEISILLYGLPMSRPVRLGPFLVQRFQRTAFQLWVEEIPGLPVPGTVTQVFAGHLYKEANLIPMEAFRPMPNPSFTFDDTLRASTRSLLLEHAATAFLVPHLDHAIIGYAPDLLDTAALRVGNWTVIYLHPALREARFEAVAAVLAHVATYLEAQSLAPVPLENTPATCKRLVAGGLRVEAALWQALWGVEGTYNTEGYEQVLNGYVREAQHSGLWADHIAEFQCA